jgi:hypothetical protein
VPPQTTNKKKLNHCQKVLESRRSDVRVYFQRRQWTSKSRMHVPPPTRSMGKSLGKGTHLDLFLWAWGKSAENPRVLSRLTCNTQLIAPTTTLTRQNGRESSGARLDRECRSPRRSQLVRTGMLPPPVTRSANPAHPGVNRGIDNRIPWKSHVRSGYVMGSCADVASKSPEGTRWSGLPKWGWGFSHFLLAECDGVGGQMPKSSAKNILKLSRKLELNAILYIK